MVHADNLCENEQGSKMLYLLDYEWTLLLEVNAARVSNATRVSTMGFNRVQSPPLETSASTITLNSATT
jgi:hypothetical protein